MTGRHSILFPKLAFVCSLNGHLAAALIAQHIFCCVRSILLGIMNSGCSFGIIPFIHPFAILSAIYSTVLAHAYFLSLKR